MAHEGLHENRKALNDETLDMHRALISLQEELEAVDWYRQRADACSDAQLKELLLHNMREEMEHAAMLIEWVRRNNRDFAGHLSDYLFTEAAITEIEEEATVKGGDGAAEGDDVAGLTIGSLKE